MSGNKINNGQWHDILRHFNDWLKANREKYDIALRQNQAACKGEVGDDD